MKYELLFGAGLCLGALSGILIGGLLASNKIDDAYKKGFERGKSVSVNSIR